MYDYELQRAQPWQLSSNKILISCLPIVFLKTASGLVDLSVVDNLPHNLGLNYVTNVFHKLLYCIWVWIMFLKNITNIHRALLCSFGMISSRSSDLFSTRIKIHPGIKKKKCKHDTFWRPRVTYSKRPDTEVKVIPGRNHSCKQGEKDFDPGDETHPSSHVNAAKMHCVL